MAIIGAGPSSFYVASRLLSLLPPTSPQGSSLKIHMFDRLWAPHGLVRYGVAPDHPEVKNCTHKFSEAASDPRLRFFGNVNVGQSASLSTAVKLPLTELLRNYTHLLFASGCPTPILHPALPPSEYCVPALSIVHWYTRHPSRPPPPPLEKTKHVTLIGQGNVSLDIARMLLTPPDLLAKYDVPQSVLSVLERSAVEHVSIVGRRGPLQAAFTVKELREMMNLPDSSMVPLDAALLQSPEGAPVRTRQQTRAVDLLKKGSKNKLGSTRKTWSLDFFRSPTGLLTPLSSSPARVPANLTLAHTELDASAHAVPTGETSTLKTDLVITSLGHRSEPGMEWYAPALGHLNAIGGRVVDPSGQIVRRVYASGWAAMGAKGVLASTMMDAYAVADTIVQDAFTQENSSMVPDGDVDVASMANLPEAGSNGLEVMSTEVESGGPPKEVEEAWREGLVTDYEDWRLVDAEEVRRGEALRKERERMAWEEAHEFLSSTRSRNSS